MQHSERHILQLHAQNVLWGLHSSLQSSNTCHASQTECIRPRATGFTGCTTTSHWTFNVTCTQCRSIQEVVLPPTELQIKKAGSCTTSSMKADSWRPHVSKLYNSLTSYCLHIISNSHAMQAYQRKNSRWRSLIVAHRGFGLSL